MWPSFSLLRTRVRKSVLSGSLSGSQLPPADKNTLVRAMDDGQKAYRVRHSKKMQFRLEELADFLAVTQEVFLKAEECFRRLAKIQMIENRLERYFEAVYPRSLVQKR